MIQRDPGSGGAAGAAEPTTLVALLGWTYRRQRADLMTGRGLFGAEREAARPARRHWSGDGCAQVAAAAALGASIAPGGWQRPALHPDAELVDDLVIEISRRDWLGATLLRRHGRTGDTPDWGGGPQRWEPVYDARERIVQDRFDEILMVPDKSGRPRPFAARYCPLAKYPPDEWVAAARAEYAAWFAALERLAKALAGRELRRWRLTGLGAGREPWRTKHEFYA